MSGITLKVDKGTSETFYEIMNLLSGFPNIKECKRHYSVHLTDEDLIIHLKKVERIIQLLPILQENEFFNIPDYGTEEWADWMIDLHQKKRGKSVKK